MSKEAPQVERLPYAIAIHGGAGTILKENMSPEMEAAYLEALETALSIGEGILQNGGSSLDAVVQTIEYLENSPLFNAGKGAVFTHEGRVELDASIMDGATRNAGAVGSLTIIKNPIKAARAVLEHSPHVFLVGSGADRFALEQGLDTVENTYFHTERRWKSLQKALEKEGQSTGQLDPYAEPDHKYGTVGCVALDRAGNLAAGTSTGGTNNKRFGRIGDSPVIGAGTYADNATCAVSCTGTGEYFIRFAVAHDVSARMAYRGESLSDAAQGVIDELGKNGGDGGLIAVDRYGHISQPFNTAGMYRAYASPKERGLFIYQK